MSQTENIQNKEIQVPLSFTYVDGFVVVQITQFAGFQIPFEAFKNGYYAVKAQKDRAKPIIEQPKIVSPNGQTLTKG